MLICSSFVTGYVWGDDEQPGQMNSRIFRSPYHCIRDTMGAVVHKVPTMTTATIELPTGAEFQRQIEVIEARTNDECICQKFAIL
jgi:hypothetical protein